MVLGNGGNNMLKIILSGCNGAMGRAVTKVALESQGVDIVAGIDKYKDRYANSYEVFESIFDFKGKADVIVDFSHPSCLDNILSYGEKKNIPIVIATTGLNDEDDKKIENTSKNIPIFKSANMSIGVNLLIDLVKKAALALQDNFDIEIVEKHHNKKVDAPSGTALMIANAINEELDNSKEYKYGREGKNAKREEREIGIHAVRGGTIPGEHTVIFAGLDEILEVKHTALSKSIFASGALKAAKFIVNKENGLYKMENLMN